MLLTRVISLVRIVVTREFKNSEFEIGSLRPRADAAPGLRGLREGARAAPHHHRGNARARGPVSPLRNTLLGDDVLLSPAQPIAPWFGVAL